MSAYLDHSHVQNKHHTVFHSHWPSYFPSIVALSCFKCNSLHALRVCYCIHWHLLEVCMYMHVLKACMCMQ
jgi:hypothetical protein